MRDVTEARPITQVCVWLIYSFTHAWRMCQNITPTGSTPDVIGTLNINVSFTCVFFLLD